MRAGPHGYRALKALVLLQVHSFPILTFETEPGTDRRRITDPYEVPDLFAPHLVVVNDTINIMRIAAHALKREWCKRVKTGVPF